MTAAEDKAEIARLRAELARVKALSIVPAAEETTEAYYWVSTMRGEQPRCRRCDGPLTRGPKGGVVDAECPQCHMNLRDGVTNAPVESR